MRNDNGSRKEIRIMASTAYGDICRLVPVVWCVGFQPVADENQSGSTPPSGQGSHGYVIQGAIGPLGISSATGLKPAHQTTGAHLGDTTSWLSGIYTAISARSVKSGRLNYLQASPFAVDVITGISFLNPFMC
ncbi:hypothetical protein CDAR_606081 [Caerostris darwini]|uniref:Uncharacterized protein n=1 Tax=Caerostris darwini TaxID=1538125 RepID=A0AAV4RB49_9ARAC|nr:hypothetical protein CDAR_606081 [Caerostris darwini]